MRVSATRSKAGGGVPAAQLEDLLIALADRRSFPETRFLAERGIVGETWSRESAAPTLVPVPVPVPVSVLPVKEPGERQEGEFVETETKVQGRFSKGSACVCVCVRLLLIPACFVMHAAAPITEITQLVDFHQRYQSRRCGLEEGVRIGSFCSPFVPQKNKDLRSE